MSVEPRLEVDRVTYAHSGIDEWYESRKEGLEQGFAVHERPLGDGVSDVIVGAHQSSNVETNERLAFVYNGSSDGPVAVEWNPLPWERAALGSSSPNPFLATTEIAGHRATDSGVGDVVR